MSNFTKVFPTMQAVVLKNLNLSHNKIRIVAPHSFSHDKAWKKLERLNLSHNLVGRLENCTFVNLFRLTSLDLSYNLLEEVWPESFATTVVRSDDVTSCRITSVQNEARKAQEDGTQRTPGNNFPPMWKNVKYDQLQGSRIVDFKGGTSTAQDQFKSANRIKKPSQDVTNRPDYCPTHKWPSLEWVDMSHNKLRIIHESTFRGALCGVRVLKIGDNFLEHLPRYVVEHLHDLEEIELQNNAITWLDVGAFTNAKLKRVDLSGNRLKKIISMTFLYLPSISTIDLSFNNITYVYKYAFYRLCRENTTDKTVRIDFRNNKLTSTSVQKMLSIFQHQESNSDPLHPDNSCRAMIDLSGNQIKEIFVETLAGLDVLHFPVRIKSDVESNDSNEHKNENVRGEAKLRQLAPSTTAVENFGFFQDVRKRFKNWNRVNLALNGNPVECNCKLAEEMHFLRFVDETFFSNLHFKQNLDEWMKLTCRKSEQMDIEAVFMNFDYGDNATLNSSRHLESNSIENSTNKESIVNGSEDIQHLEEFLKLEKTRKECPTVNYICPLRCVCRYDDNPFIFKSGKHKNVYHVNCSNAGFFHFPLFPLRNASIIDLSFNDLESFDTFSSFSDELLRDYGLDKIVFINFSSNHIVSFNYFPFHMFSSLTHLDFRHNRLESLPMEIFRHLPFLDHVMLSNNPLTCPCSDPTHPSSSLSMTDVDVLSELNDKRKLIIDLKRVTCFLTSTWSAHEKDGDSGERKIFYEDVLTKFQRSGKKILSLCSNEMPLPEPQKSHEIRNWNVLYLIVLFVIACFTLMTILCFSKFKGQCPRKPTADKKCSNWLRGGGNDVEEKCFIYKCRKPKSCVVLTFRTNNYSNDNFSTILNSLLELIKDEYFDRVIVCDVDLTSQPEATIVNQTMKHQDYWVVVLRSTPFLSVSRDFQLESFSVPTFLKNELVRRLETSSATLVIIPDNPLNIEPLFQEDLKKYSHSILYTSDAQFGRKFAWKMALFSKCGADNPSRVGGVKPIQKKDGSLEYPTKTMSSDFQLDHYSVRY